MTKYGSGDVGFILVNGYELAQNINEVSYGQSANSQQTNCFGDRWVENTYVGIREHNLAIKGFYDDGTDNTDAAFRTTVGSNKVFCMALEGNTQGVTFDGLQGPIAESYNRLVERGGLTMFETQFVAHGAMDTGKILSTLAAKTSSSNSTGVDNTSSTANGGAGYLQVSAFSGFTSVAIKVQHSTDNSTWVDLASFTSVTSAPTAEYVGVAAGTTVRRYLRALWTVTGSGSITFFVGFARR